MVDIIIVTKEALLIARPAYTSWTVTEYLNGQSPICVAVDTCNTTRIYCGTASGLFRSDDRGQNWKPVGPGINHPKITTVAVAKAKQPDGFGLVYAGTEPSAIFRSDNGGNSWEDLTNLHTLRSANTWSYPPRPHTHHVRWIAADVNAPDRVFVAIEAGALVRTFDGGRIWHDRVSKGPYDTHTAVTHPLAPGRIYSAAGDGYFESSDAGDSWKSPEDGLKHNYLVGIAVDPTDSDTVIVSAAEGPESAYSPQSAKTYVYRKSGNNRWKQAMDGMPDAKGTTVTHFATCGEQGDIYAANNRDLFKSDDGGCSWKTLDLPWPGQGLANGVKALACL